MKEELFTPARNLDWAVLRCPPISTMKVEQDLQGLGFRVWTPVCWVHKRVPRRRSRVWDKTAVLSSFLFIRVNELEELLLRRVVGVRPMMDLGRVVALEDWELDPLREQDTRDEEPWDQQKDLEKWVAGELVEVGHTEDEKATMEHLFGCYEGSVQDTNGAGEVLVALKNSTKPIWFQGFLLSRVVVGSR